MPRRPPEPGNRHGRTRRDDTHLHQRTADPPAPWARFGALVLVSLATLAVTAPAPGGAQEGAVVLSGTYDWDRAIPIEDMVVSTDQPMGIAGGCREKAIQLDPPQSRFRFSEPETEKRCGWADYSFQPPAAIDSFTVSFVADRRIGHPGDTPSTAVAAIQTISVYEGGNQTMEGEYAYFDSIASDKEPQSFSIDFDLANTSKEHSIRWRFEDHDHRGPGALSTSLTNFSADVWRPRLLFESVPLDAGRIIAQDVSEQNRTRTTTTQATLDIPDLIQSQGDTARVEVQLQTGDALIGIRTPGGVPLNIAVVPEEATGIERSRILDTDVLANHGPGTYTFTFQRTETLPPPAAPPAPATIYPLVYLLSLLPAPTAAYAYAQVWRVRKVSEGGFGRAGGLYIGAAALTLGYAGLLAFLYFSGVLSGVATLPVAGIDPFVFAGFIVLALGFILLGALVARAVLRALQRDLDERRRIQMELERSNQELEHFAYVASHDLQEPLRTISGFSQLLQKRYGDELDERAVRYITRTVEGTDRMSRLINDLLEYSRVDSRGRPLEPTDLNKLLDEVKQDLETMMHSAGATVTADRMPTVMADKTQVAQVLSNLIRNAIKYRHPDRAPKVHVSSSQEDGSWVISVSDNGMGIPEDQQERAFVIFQRLVPRETDDTGTGLGLAISRKIVERHGGRIWVESDGSTGSTFRFTLPRDPSTNGAITGADAEARPRGRRQRGNRAAA